MTESRYSSVDGYPIPRTPLRLAVKFYRRASQFRRRANVCLVAGLAIVSGGIGFAIVLPPVIPLIDRWISEFDPRDETKKLADRIDVLTQDLTSISDRRKELVQTVHVILSSPATVWKRPMGDGGQRSMSRPFALHKLPSGDFIAAGWESGEGASRAHLLRVDRSGETWTPLRPTDREERVEGRLYDLYDMPDGGFIAAGVEGSVFWSRTFLLHVEKDEETWKPIRPVEDGQRIAGALMAIHGATSGGFIAAGSESDEGPDLTLIMRSDSKGENWVPVRPRNSGERIEGQLHAVKSMPKGGFIAAGREYGEGAYYTLFLRSDPTGETWDPIRPKDGIKRIKGMISAVHPVAGGGFIAVGWEQDEHANLALILRSDKDGMTWTPIRPVDRGRRIVGRLYSVRDVPGGGFVAAGSESVAFQTENDASRERTLILRSDNDIETWVPIRPTEAGERIKGRIYALHSDAGGAFVAAGWESERNTQQALILRSSRYSEPLHLDGSPVPGGELEKVSNTLAGLANIGDVDGLTLPWIVEPIREDARRLLIDWQTKVSLREELVVIYNQLSEALAQGEIWQRVSRIATRVAVIGLLIYLVQLMVNLYRYSTRLAAFYQARGDAILLTHVAGLNVESWASLKYDALAATMSPDTLDFGKAPATPNQHVIELAREALRSSHEQSKERGEKNLHND